MIKDLLKNAELYYSISENLKQGFEWILNTDLANLPCGRYEINGEKLYANVQEYETKADANYEAHRKYIDIQCVVKGKELVGVTDISNGKTVETYDNKKDIEFLSTNKPDEYFELNNGEFIVLFPQNAHKPSISAGEKTSVKKVVVKAALD